MQNQHEDTQWNDALRKQEIIPKKEIEVKEEDIINMVEASIQQKTQGKCFQTMSLGELNDQEDDIDDEEEQIFEQYRRKRLAEIQASKMKANYGDVREISKDEYIQEVNKAGKDVWVVLLVYKNSIPLCKLIEQYIYSLARKFPCTKFLKSISSVCIENYPDKNLPTIFVYYNGEKIKQFIGPFEFRGMNLKQDELEWLLSKTGAFKTTLEENPIKAIHDHLNSSIIKQSYNQDSDSD